MDVRFRNLITVLFSERDVTTMPARIAVALYGVVKFDSWALVSVDARNESKVLAFQGCDADIAEYKTNQFLEEPFYLAATSGSECVSQAYRMARRKRTDCNRDSSPCAARSVLADKFGYVFRLDDGTVLMMFLMRSAGSHRFSDSSFRQFDKASDAVRVAMEFYWRKHKSCEQNGVVETPDDTTPASMALWCVGDAELDPIEFEVLELLLHSQSSKSIGRVLGMTTKDVGRHTKSVYQKLRVTSRRQLFSRLLQTMANGGSSRKKAVQPVAAGIGEIARLPYVASARYDINDREIAIAI